MSARWGEWWSRVTADLDNGVAPGGACWVAVDGDPVCHATHGLARVEPAEQPLDRGMRFDLASLTKVVATTSCIMALVEDERLDLDAPAAEHLPELREHGKGAITPRQLITHQAGLPAWVTFFRTCADRDEVRSQVLATPCENEPGSEVVYSDVGFLTLGFLIEALTGQREDRYLRQRVLEPLGLADDIGYLPPDPDRCVATERCGIREGVQQGVVHDENAWRCGGVAGHAGLFGTVEAVGQFGQAMLDGRVFSEPVTREMFRLREDVAREQFWLGWTRFGYDSGDASCFGHTGFTGTLLWVSPALRLAVCILTNRVHPTRANTLIGEKRPEWVSAATALAGDKR